MPDGGRTLNPAHIVHRSIIVIASPDTHHIISCIAQRPVIAEIVGRTCLGRRRADRSAITVPAVLLRIGVELQDVAIEEFGDARLVIAQHAGNQIRQLRTDDLLAGVVLVLVGHM